VEWEALRTKVSWLPFVLRCFPICPDDSIGTPRFAGSPKRSYLLFVAFVFFVVLSFIRVICAFREAEPVPKNLSVVYSPGRMTDGNYLFGSG